MLLDTRNIMRKMYMLTHVCEKIACLPIFLAYNYARVSVCEGSEDDPQTIPKK